MIRGNLGATEPAAHFSVELDPWGKSGLLLAAGVFSWEEGEEQEQVREYAVTLLREFFSRKGNSLQVSDGGLVLQKILHHLHREIKRRWGDANLAVSAVLALARPEKVFLARCGKAQALLYRKGVVTPAFAHEEHEPLPLGSGDEVGVETGIFELQPGDVLALEDPAISPLIRPRDLTVILQRAGDLHQAGVLLAAVAEKKRAARPFTALLWEAPNLRRDAIFFDELNGGLSPEREREEKARDLEGEVKDTGTVEQVKRRWLDRFRRHRG